ncbi:hypothetical protein GCM10011505_03800 [Tistrella bauzanensis]|uniref:Motility protein B-like N-terminal domain-containing protein n=1 Tax=Tistrella bauzanensis TaxID=657419 RepID=A0ABQ1I8G2_9PROT|nr:hypothetical protein [Tistrella bauzanensis]GGB25828.1 hypothetical protein GCM10011505_03800 [Tistrella bauzanensis]
MQDEGRHPVRKHADTNVALYLGLYLILLSFFIMLNVISHVSDHRVKATVDSLQSTFATETQSEGRIESLAILYGPGSISEAFQNALFELLQAAIPHARVQSFDNGNVLQVRVPMADVFYEGEPRVLPQVTGLLDRVSDLLVTRGTEVREVVFSIGLGGGPSDGEERMGILRAGVLARTVVSHGVPERLIATGIGDQSGNDLVIEFRMGSPPQIGTVPIDAGRGR